MALAGADGAARRRAASSGPRDDLTTALVTTEVDGERLTHQEIASFFILLLVAGNETTRNAITQGVLALSEHPEQRARWAADPSLDPHRGRGDRPLGQPDHLDAAHGDPGRRAATGTGSRQGDKFLLFYAAANRDPEVFRDPHVFDLARDPNPHVGFGGQGPALLPRRAPGPPGDRA